MLNYLFQQKTILPVPRHKNGVEILVFKTSLADARHISEVETLLDDHPNIIQWNVDLDDCDHVLRIVSREITASEIEQLMLGSGVYCEELE
ncbi:MAG: hypothetical protein JST86_04735 [Bacteroidetes bacterium]|nr:hypothetical protein [Bacteroidota bacterium]